MRPKVEAASKSFEDEWTEVSTELVRVELLEFLIPAGRRRFFLSSFGH